MHDYRLHLLPTIAKSLFTQEKNDGICLHCPCPLHKGQSLMKSVPQVGFLTFRALSHSQQATQVYQVLKSISSSSQMFRNFNGFMHPP